MSSAVLGGLEIQDVYILHIRYMFRYIGVYIICMCIYVCKYLYIYICIRPTMPSMVLGSNPNPFDFRAFSFGGLFLKQDLRSNNIEYIILYLIRYIFNFYT